MKDLKLKRENNGTSLHYPGLVSVDELFQDERGLFELNRTADALKLLTLSLLLKLLQDTVAVDDRKLLSSEQFVLGCNLNVRNNLRNTTTAFLD